MGGAAARPPSSPPSSPRRLASRRFGPHRGASGFSRPRAAAASSSFVVNTHHTYTHPPPRRCLWRPSSLPPAQPRALRAFSAFYFGPGLPDLSHPPSRALFPTHTHITRGSPSFHHLGVLAASYTTSVYRRQQPFFSPAHSSSPLLLPPSRLSIHQSRPGRGPIHHRRGPSSARRDGWMDWGKEGGGEREREKVGEGESESGNWRGGWVG